MMTSSNGNIFRVTGPLCGEFTGPGEFPAQRSVTRSFDVFFDLRLNKRLSKQPWGWWFETPACSLWRHRNVVDVGFTCGCNGNKQISTKWYYESDKSLYPEWSDTWISWYNDIVYPYATNTLACTANTWELFSMYIKSKWSAVNRVNPVYGVATVCHQVRWLRRGHPSLFHAATSLIIWYEMFCMRKISYKLIWIEFIISYGFRTATARVKYPGFM